MAISDIPVLSALRTKMQWHQERQRVLAENVANAETPGFRPKELAEPKPAAIRSAYASTTLSSSPTTSLSAAYGLARTDAAHFSISSGSMGGFEGNTKNDYETRPTGNAVNLEDEMLKVSANQMDYQAAAGLYSRSLALMKTAIGR